MDMYQLIMVPTPSNDGAATILKQFINQPPQQVLLYWHSTYGEEHLCYVTRTSCTRSIQLLRQYWNEAVDRCHQNSGG